MTPKLPYENEWGQSWAEEDEVRQVHGIEPEDLCRPLIEDEYLLGIDRVSRPSEMDEAA